jgi:hypothetical protein
MTPNKEILLALTPFTGLGLYQGFRGDFWFKKRIELFKNYTLKSMSNQEDKDFIHWICFREEERTNPLTIELEDYLKSIGYRFLFTYGGIPFWDDKYPKDNLLERLRVILPQLKEIVGNAEVVREWLVPSDDMYSQEVSESIKKVQFKEKTAIVHKKGYVYNAETDQLAEWIPTTNPPFYTILYPADVFLDPQKHFDYLEPYRSHEDIAKIFKNVVMPDGRYCVVVHSTNISTIWEHPFKGKEFYYETEKKNILKTFGL